MITTAIGHKRIQNQATVMPTQTPSAFSEFTFQSRFSDPYEFELNLYNFIRKTIPLLDVAIIKHIQLIGNFNIIAKDSKAIQKEIDYLMKSIKVNYFENGMNEWTRQLVDAALETGIGFGESIPYKNLKGIAKLKNAETKKIKFVKKDGELLIGANDSWLSAEAFQNQDWIYALAFDRRQGHPRGYSMFYSMPFVAQLMTKILKTIENQTVRMGDPTFLFIIEAAGDTPSDYKLAKDAITGIESNVKTAYKEKRSGRVADIFGATPGNSKFVVKTLGADIELMPLEIPMKLILEQIIAKTGFPPFFFGIHWSSTYNITKHQSDMIINKIKDYRSGLETIINKVVDLHLTMAGLAGAKFEIEWNSINLLDLVEQARARQMNAKAIETEISNLVTLVGMGWETVENAIDILIENNVIKKKDLKEKGYEKLWKEIEAKTKLAMATQVYRNMARS